MSSSNVCRMSKEEEIIQYIYLLKEREFIKTGEPIYKAGKSKQLNLGRFSQYPKGSTLYFQLIVPDCDKLERIILHKFKGKYIQRPDIGIEYFQGDVLKMIDDIYWECFEYRKRMENPTPPPKVLYVNFDKFIYNPDDTIKKTY